MQDNSIPDRFDIDVVHREDLATKLGLGGDELRPEMVVRIVAADTRQTWGYVAVDNTVRGPSLGGLRLVPDATLEELRDRTGATCSLAAVCKTLQRLGYRRKKRRFGPLSKIAPTCSDSGGGGD